jgi:hypothetical protein
LGKGGIVLKKILGIILVLCMVFTTGVLAAPAIKIVVNGQAAQGVDVKVISGTTYLPLRAIGELLDVPVAWDGATKTVTVGSEAALSSKVTQATPAPAPVAKTGKYVGSTESDKYHNPTCQWARKIDSANELWFKDAGAANAAGYVPCGVCKP